MATVPAGPRGPEPLCAVWGKGALPEVSRALGEGRLSLQELIKSLPVHIVGEEEVAGADPGFRSFRNLNTPGAWADAEDAASGER